MTVFPLIQVVHNRPEIISKNPLKNQGARLLTGDTLPPTNFPFLQEK